MTEIALLAFSLFLLVAGIWVFHCNGVTKRQRRAIVFGLRTMPIDLWLSRIVQYKSVTYGEHFWCILRRRDPSDLYGFEVPKGGAA